MSLSKLDNLPLVGKIVLNVVKADLKRDKRIILRMNPWVRIQIGELHTFDSKIATRQGKTPNFNREQIIFKVSRHDPKILKIQVFDKEKTAFCCNKDQDNTDADLIAEGEFNLA